MTSLPPSSVEEGQVIILIGLIHHKVSNLDVAPKFDRESTSPLLPPSSKKVIHSMDTNSHVEDFTKDKAYFAFEFSLPNVGSTPKIEGVKDIKLKSYFE